MKPALLVLSILLVTVSCSSGTSVGSGAGFDTFTTQPTAADFGSAILFAAKAQSVNARLGITKAMRDGLLPGGARSATIIPTLTPSSKSGTKACAGGGTIAWSSSINNTSAQGQATLSRCSITVNVAGKGYAEELTGSVTADATRSDSEIRITYRGGVSGSGDIGFAVDCGLTLVITSTAGTTTGSCTFRDAAGRKIEGTGDELSSFFFY
ncbi:MAG: hypothetical protein V1495_01785 [Pseudomonadota bacterium]